MSNVLPCVESDSQNENLVAITAGRALEEAAQKVQTFEDEGKPFLILDGAVRDMSEYLALPVRAKERIALGDVESFIAYVTLFKQSGTRIFYQARPEGCNMRAILDYHLGGGGDDTLAAWCEHLADYTFPLTPEWQELVTKNMKKQSQQDFAEMVERLRHIWATPAAADMLEIARSLEAKTEGTFKSGLRRSNGDRELIFTTATEARAGAEGKVEIPESVNIAVAPFLNGSVITIEAFLRFRITEGRLAFELELVRPHDVINHAVREVVDKVEGAIGVRPLLVTSQVH